MAYEQGYAGDPRGREAAVEARQGRDGFSFEDKKAARSMGGSVYDRGPGAVSKTSPEESFSAKPIAKPAAPLIAPKPAPTKTTFYLDETPAFAEQQVAPVAKVSTYEESVSAKPTAPKQTVLFKDWKARTDKTLGAQKEYAKRKQMEEEFQITPTGYFDKISNKVADATELLMSKYSPQSKWSKYNENYDYKEDTNLRDVIRHGVFTNRVGYLVSQSYETFQTSFPFLGGMQLSDYKNNHIAKEFAKTLSSDQDFDDAWAAMVTQERNNPGSTGWDIDFKAGGSEDITVGDVTTAWASNFNDQMTTVGGLLANWANKFTGGGGVGLITKASAAPEGGGG